MGYEIFEMLCAKKGIKPFHVSKETGISTATLSSWKTGRYAPKPDKLQKIADYFGVSLEYLLTGKGSEKESTSGQKYYFDDDTAKKAQELFEKPNLRILFDAAQGSKPEDLQMAADLLARLKETNPDG